MRCRQIGATSTNAENRVAQIDILQDIILHTSHFIKQHLKTSAPGLRQFTIAARKMRQNLQTQFRAI
jgi:hypothetical protein